MKHRVLIPTLLMSAIGATTAFAIDKTYVSRENPQAPVQQSAVVEGVDLYDRVKLIPWDKLQSFFNQHLSR